MLKENRKLMDKVLAECVLRYGEEAQGRQAMEECAELIQAINKVLRKGVTIETLHNLVEEMADVYLLIEQLKMVYSIDDSNIEEVMMQKIHRQVTRFEEEDNK
jgi:NTP pyrophosphatase (non-canonical NTP hydrolase)